MPFGGLNATFDWKKKWFVGLSGQIQSAGGKNRITKTVSIGGVRDANGEYTRKYLFIGITPTIGKSFERKSFRFCVYGGMDYAFELELSEQFKTTDSSGHTFIQGYSGGIPEFNDVRLAAGLNFSHKKLGVDICF